MVATAADAATNDAFASLTRSDTLWKLPAEVGILQDSKVRAPLPALPALCVCVYVCVPPHLMGLTVPLPVVMLVVGWGYLGGSSCGRCPWTAATSDSSTKTLHQSSLR
jgi:hypothetical protein